MKKNVEGSLLVIGSIALEALSVLFQREGEKIRASFPSFFVEQVTEVLASEKDTKAAGKKLEEQIQKQKNIADVYGILDVRPLGRGGIFNALWNTCEKLKSGCEVELERIPVLQETIEICEFFDVNPYYARSDGSALVAAKRGNELLWFLKDCGIEAEIIGVLKPGRSRTIRSGPEHEHVRCLDRPQKDSLEEVL